MKIVFLNTWSGKRRKALVDYIKQQARDTDVFCFQEATDEMKQLTQDTLSHYRELSDFKYFSDEDNFPQSLFIRKGIEVLSFGTLMAGQADCGLAIYTEIKVENSSIYICNVHGKAQPGDKLDDDGRLKQSQDIIDFFKDKNVPIIIGGDFNILPDTKSIQMFKHHGYRNLIEEFNIDTTRNHLAWDRFPTKMYYSDYVFLNEAVTLKRFAVVKNEVSDHLPMLLEIEA
jgi:endonuclease/exonuclease/phosphatase family metal-dependent hydrolase